MDYLEALQIVTRQVLALKGHTVDVITIKRPREIQGALELAKVILKFRMNSKAL